MNLATFEEGDGIILGNALGEAPSGGGKQTSDSAVSRAIECTACGERIDDGERRWKTCRQHYRCGSALDRAAKTCNRSDEVTTELRARLSIVGII